MELANQFITPGILFLLTVVFGFWLSHTGKPYNGVLFNIHKLIALSLVILAAIQFWKIVHAPNGELAALLALLALCVIALFVSGALMSAGKLDYTTMLTIHRAAPAALAFCGALMLYWLGNKP
ncbi:MAG: hypothetical protein IPM53_07855 [Anaerolineaceae bacterium]|nr:hypothetical protein [Anaerolineaceae bacterium]